MSAYKYSLPAGVPGMVTRGGATVEPQVLDSSNQPTAFGQAVVLDSTSHKLRAFGASDTAALGFLVRPYPTSSGDDFGPAQTFAGGQVLGVMRRGYMSVKLNSGTAVNGGKVYARVANPSGAKVIGGLEAASDTTNTVELTNAKFTGAADSDGNVEIEFNL